MVRGDLDWTQALGQPSLDRVLWKTGLGRALGQPSLDRVLWKTGLGRALGQLHLYVFVCLLVFLLSSLRHFE